MAPPRKLAWATLVALAAVPHSAPSPLAAAIFPISDGQAFSDVGSDDTIDIDDFDTPVVSPDGRWVIYPHDAETNEALELFRANVAGGQPERISGLLPASAEVVHYAFTPDGSRIVWTAAQDIVDTVEIYSAPSGGTAGSFVKVNEALDASFNAVVSGISADSQSAVYYVNNGSTHENNEIWYATLDGETQDQRVLLPSGRDIFNVEVSADFSRIVYLADATVNDRFEVWSVGTTSGTPIQLNGALVAGGDVGTFAVAPVGNLVAYVADQQEDGTSELYVVANDGVGGADKVNAPLADGEQITGASWFPGGAHLLYGKQTGGDVAFWAVEPDGDNPVQLSGAMVDGGGIVAGAVSADWLVYVADQQQDERFELYSVPVTGGSVGKLNPALPDGADVRSDPPPQITPDGIWVIYAADAADSGHVNLYRVSIAGGPSTPLSPTTTGNTSSSSIRGFAISEDSSRVAFTRDFRATLISGPNVDLYSSPIVNPAPVRMDNCVTGGRNVYKTPVVSPADPEVVFYIADQDVDEQFDLYVSDLCVLCDGFESGGFVRWDDVVP